jgi:hypothetical protein
MWSAFLATCAGLALAGCAGNGNNGGTPSAGWCKNPPATGPESTVCQACATSKCASEYAALGASCTAVDTCSDQCDCGDSACRNACLANNPISDTCATATEHFNGCAESRCAVECSAPDSGLVDVSASNFNASNSCYSLSNAGECNVDNMGDGGACPSGETQGLCPAQGLVGCCITPSGAYNSATCVYTSAWAGGAAFEASCTGFFVWTTQDL